MLTLEVVPERSLGCEQWEFILGGYPIELFLSIVKMRLIYLFFILHHKQSVFAALR